MSSAVVCHMQMYQVHQLRVGKVLKLELHDETMLRAMGRAGQRLNPHAGSEY